MQAAQWGWLHSTPKPHKDTRLKMYGTPIGIDDGIAGKYLLDALFAVGPSEFRGGEESPIRWAELLAYGNATGAISEPFEFEAVMSMSKAYFYAKLKGNEDAHAMSPVDQEELRQ